jgi:hypothetical protein
MFGVPDLGKLSEEIHKFHELTDETAKLVAEVQTLNANLARLIELIEPDTKKKKGSAK